MQQGRAPVAGRAWHQWARGVGLIALQQLGGGLACLSAPAVTAKRRHPGIPCCGLAGQSGQGGDVTWRSCCPKSPKTSTWTWIEPETNLPTPQLQLKSGVAAHAARPAALRPPVAHRHVSDGPAYPARQLPPPRKYVVAGESALPKHSPPAFDLASPPRHAHSFTQQAVVLVLGGSTQRRASAPPGHRVARIRTATSPVRMQ